MPALYSLAFRRLLPERFAVVGAARTEGTDDELPRADARGGRAVRARRVPASEVWDELAAGMRYVALDAADGRGEDRLAATLAELDAERGTEGNRVYYFAVPPSAIAPARPDVAEHGAREGWTRLIIEKPFGHDLASAARAERADRASTSTRARSSASTTTSARRPSRTCSRCASPTASSSRSGTASSSTTSRSPSPSRSGSRAAPRFYEQAGAIRDIFQNHLLQLVAITAMEPPIDFTADSVRNEKVKVLRSLHTPGPEVGRARPVRARLHRGRRGARLPRGGGRRARLD